MNQAKTEKQLLHYLVYLLYIIHIKGTWTGCACKLLLNRAPINVVIYMQN